MHCICYAKLDQRMFLLICVIANNHLDCSTNGHVYAARRIIIEHDLLTWERWDAVYYNVKWLKSFQRSAKANERIVIVVSGLCYSFINLFAENGKRRSIMGEANLMCCKYKYTNWLLVESGCSMSSGLDLRWVVKMMNEDKSCKVVQFRLECLLHNVIN